MTTQQFLKGLMMALVAVIVTYFSTTPIDFLMMGLAAICAILTYTGKNLISVLHSDSPVGALSIINIVSALLIALGAGILNGAAMIIVDGVIVWAVLGKLTLSIVFTYLGSTLFAPPYNTNKVKGFHK
jgi:hypothetical protein